LARIEGEFAAEAAEVDAVETEAALVEAEVERLREDQAAKEKERLVEPRRAEVEKIKAVIVNKEHAVLLEERKRADLEREFLSLPPVSIYLSISAIDYRCEDGSFAVFAS
jgi:hypothetical protein